MEIMPESAPDNQKAMRRHIARRSERRFRLVGAPTDREITGRHYREVKRFYGIERYLFTGLRI
jgi:hypothetical protein